MQLGISEFNRKCGCSRWGGILQGRGSQRLCYKLTIYAGFTGDYSIWKNVLHYTKMSIFCTSVPIPKCSMSLFYKAVKHNPESATAPC